MEFMRLRIEPPPGGEEDDQSPHANPSNQQITTQQVSDSELTGYLASNTRDDDGHNRKADMECESEDEDGDFWCTYRDGIVSEETDYEQEVGKIESEMEESSDTMSETSVRIKSNWSSEDDGDFWCTYLDGLDLEKTDYEQEVGKRESEIKESSATILDVCVKKRNWGSEDECGSDEDYLCCDDLLSKERENEHEVLADDQEATTSLEGHDIQCSKTIEEKKKGIPSDGKLLVDFSGPSSENLVKSSLLATNPTDPVCERTAAYVHQVGPQKQNGVQNTFDEHFSSTTSDVSFQMSPKYQLKEENIPQIGQETRRLAILGLDLSPVRAADLFTRMSCFLPKGGKIMSVDVYTTEKRGPVGLSDDEIEEVQILASRYCKRYYGVVECDSTDTAKFVYDDFTKIFSYIGVTRKMLELRFIPDAMEFKDNLRDSATEEPTTCGGPDLVHLLSAKDLEEIGVVVTKRERPERPEGFSMNQMWDDSGLSESLGITDGDDDVLEAPSETKLHALDYTNL